MRRLLALLIIVAAAVVLAPTAAFATGVCPTANTASTYAGTQLETSGEIASVAQMLYNVGYHDADDLLAGTSIAMAESAMWTQARHWHPEYGCRPATDYIGVQGPNSVWSSDHTQQVASDRGLWQISYHWFPQYNDHITDTAYAAGAVQAIQTDPNGTGWNEWDTYDSGAAQSHYDASVDGFPAVRPIIIYFCATGGRSCT